MFNIIRYLRDRRIPFVAEHEWVNTTCPLCRSTLHGSNPSKPYLGFNLKGNYFHCWRCGGRDIEDYIAAVERVDYPTACRIAMEYNETMIWRPPPDHKPKAMNTKLDWPPGIMPLMDAHRQYLRNRNFDPEHLERKYGLKGTGPAGSYAWRVMVPIIVCGQMVSYQGRDITGKGEPKYKACRKELEVMDHKKTLYNIDNAGATGILVEGVFDAWRIGDSAVATMGTSTTREQVSLAAARFRKVFTLFDPEKPAQRRALAICRQLQQLGIKAMNIELDRGDPADMDPADAKRLKDELMEW